MMQAFFSRQTGVFIFALIGLMLLETACQTTKSQAVGSRKPPVFEIREAQCQENTGPSFWSYSCHATLVTRDPQYQSGNVVVWYEDLTKDKDGKPTHPEPSSETTMMSEGVATVTGGVYYSRRQKDDQFTVPGVQVADTDPGPPRPEWKILGFARLQPVELKTQN
jgi:hypothetical protein